MYDEYRFPIQNPEKAHQKQMEIRKKYGYQPEVYKIQKDDGQEWLSIVIPKGLVPVKPRTKKHTGFDI